MSGASESWPEAPVEGWLETCATLQLWSQMVGKVRLARAPFQNHWWHVPLYLTARGLTTSPMPDGGRTFQIDFDLIDHLLAITTSDGDGEVIQLAPGTVAGFYAEFMMMDIDGKHLKQLTHFNQPGYPESSEEDSVAAVALFNADGSELIAAQLLTGASFPNQITWRIKFAGRCGGDGGF